jgi:4-aminobutyrate aminotransferase-like enzyme
MLETFQGWGAVFYPNDFVKAIEKTCRQNDILLAFDEMQAGFGRTGKNFGYQHYGVQPDLIACGKGMGGGVPLSGVIGRAEIMDLPEVGNMSSTHSANPLVCAAGLAVIEELERRDLVESAKDKGNIFQAELENLKIKYKDIEAYNIIIKNTIIYIIILLFIVINILLFVFYIQINFIFSKYTFYIIIVYILTKYHFNLFKVWTSL